MHALVTGASPCGPLRPCAAAERRLHQSQRTHKESARGRVAALSTRWGSCRAAHPAESMSMMPSGDPHAEWRIWCASTMAYFSWPPWKRCRKDGGISMGSLLRRDERSGDRAGNATRSRRTASRPALSSGENTDRQRDRQTDRQTDRHGRFAFVSLLSRVVVGLQMLSKLHAHAFTTAAISFSASSSARWPRASRAPRTTCYS